MAKENLTKEPIVDALRPLEGEYFLSNVRLISKFLKEIKDRDGNIKGYYWQLVLSTGSRLIHTTTGDGNTTFGSTELPFEKIYDIGFHFDQDKNNSNLYKLKIADYRESLKS